MSNFRQALFASDLIQFRMKSGQVLTRLTAELERPPYNAVAWRIEDDGPWCRDFGGRYLETGTGKLIWQEYATR